jgi:hypothetical protein
MNQIAFPEIKLIVNERIQKAERRHLLAEVRSPARPAHVGSSFGLRRPVVQGA